MSAQDAKAGTPAPALTNHTADKYNKLASFVYSDAFTKPVLDLLDAQPGERIIDLGCGTGELTSVLARLVGPEGEIVAVDSSDDMLNKARASSATEGITFLKGDIQNFSKTADPSLKGSFDAVFTSAVLHWCKADPGGVVDTVKWLLKPGGRFAFEFGGFGNAVGVRGAIHQVLRSKGVDPLPLDPFYYPTVRQYEKVLREHGLTPVKTDLVPRPTPVPTGLYGWLTMFARNTFFSTFPDGERDALLREVEALCAPDSYWTDANPGTGVLPDSAQIQAEGESGWEVMYTRLRGRAVLSE